MIGLITKEFVHLSTGKLEGSKVDTRKGDGETPWKHPEKHPENTLETPWKYLETPWKHPENTLETPWKHPENTLETPWKHPENTLETPWKRPENALKTPENTWKHPDFTTLFLDFQGVFPHPPLCGYPLWILAQERMRVGRDCLPLRLRSRLGLRQEGVQTTAVSSRELGIQSMEDFWSFYMGWLDLENRCYQQIEDHPRPPKKLVIWHKEGGVRMPCFL